MSMAGREPVRIVARNVNEAAPLLIRVSAEWADPVAAPRATTSVLYEHPLEVVPSWPKVNPFGLLFAGLDFVTGAKSPVYLPFMSSRHGTSRPVPIQPNEEPFARVYAWGRELITFRPDRAAGVVDVYSYAPESDPVFEVYRLAVLGFFMERKAHELGLQVGQHERVLVDFSPDCLETKEALRGVASPAERTLRPLYPTTTVNLCSLPVGRWDREADTFAKRGAAASYTDPFLKNVASPMLEAAHALEYLNGAERYDAARMSLRGVAAGDWRTAAHEWIDRKESEWKSST